MRALAVYAAAAITVTGCAWISPNKLPENVPAAEQTALPSAAPAEVTEDADLAGQVPGPVAKTGTLTFVTDPEYSPMQFTIGDNLTIVGADVELGDAIAAKLGLASAWTGAAFDQLIGEVDAGTYDAAMSALTITDSRLERANLVSYLKSGLAWAVAAGNPERITPDDACGHRVAVQRFTVQADDLIERSAKCTAGGEPAITIEFYGVQSAATTALLNGSVDATVADSPVIAYSVERNGAIEQAGEVYDEALLGIALAKSDEELATVVREALQELIDEGTYQQILDRWGMTDAAVRVAELNPQP